MLVPQSQQALWGSIAVTFVALILFGALKGKFTGTSILRLKRFAEVELGIGLTVLFAAASLTSQPPGVDLTRDRASFAEVVDRFATRFGVEVIDAYGATEGGVAVNRDAEERAGAPVLRRWVRAAGPSGRPIDALTSRELKEKLLFASK